MGRWLLRMRCGGGLIRHGKWRFGGGGMLLRLFGIGTVIATAIVLGLQMRGVFGESRRRGGWKRGSVFGIGGCGLLRVSRLLYLACVITVERLVVTHFLRV